MKIIYEKHQRDYTVLFTSIVFEEFFTQEFKKIFHVKSFYPMYVLIKNGILYHFLAESDYKLLAISWFKKNRLVDFKKYKNKIDKLLIGYRKFFEQSHNNLEKDIRMLVKYLKDFTPIIVIAAYVLNYNKVLNKKFFNLLIKTRKQYEDVHKFGMSLLAVLLNKFEKERRIQKDSLRYLSAKEFNHFLTENKLPRNIKGRKNFILLEHSLMGEKIYNKNLGLKKIKNLDRKILKSPEKIQGNIAFPGIFKGKVRIIRLVKDMNKFKNGEVLVTSMTDPRYVSIMKKAGAIITDEGGITCHAAIVARELKKPCVIGTKIATKVLKDGQLVEVDANRGIVKIIRKRYNEASCLENSNLTI